MKKFFMTLSLAIVTMAAMAVPAKPGVWKTLKLADGTEVRAQLKGDEHGHYWLTDDGRAYRQMGNTDVFQMVDLTTVRQQAKERRQRVNGQRARRLAKRRASASSGYFGKKKGIIILVNFSDKSFEAGHNNALFTRIANEPSFSEGDFCGSMSDYFKAQSGGQFELDFDVVGPVTVSKKQSYYGENDNSDNDMYAGEMVCEAVKLAKNEIADWTPYDWDNDGEVDQVYVIYAGEGEAAGGADYTIWPHAYDLSSANYWGDGTGPVSVGTNLEVNTYACGPELSGEGQIEGIGTMCHEFSHCLGYPDFYDTDYSGGWGMDMWDLMDQGSYNGDGFLPAGYTSYERWVAGWSEPVELGDDDVTVTDMKSLQDGGEYYIIYNPENRNEYYLLENRQYVGWDVGLPGAGLLILHVDYDEDVWASNKPNDEPKHQRMTWVAADNAYQYETYQGTKYLTWDGLETDPYPYVTSNKTNNKFNKDTKPAAKFYNKKSTMSTNMTSSVEDITLDDEEGTISFNYVANYASSSGDDPVVTPTGDNLFYESFNQCAGTGGNDDQWNGSIANSAMKTSDADKNGWAFSNGYKAYHCVKLGTGGKKGTATTPAFAVNGTATLTFRAGAWDKDGEGMTLIISVDNGTISQSVTRATSSNSITVTMQKGEFTDYSLTISATGNVRVTFEAERKDNNRFFLDEVMVVDPNSTTGISPVTRQPSSLSDAWYTLDGRKLTGKPTRKGIYIFNGKKIVVEK